MLPELEKTDGLTINILDQAHLAKFKEMLNDLKTCLPIQNVELDQSERDQLEEHLRELRGQLVILKGNPFTTSKLNKVSKDLLAIDQQGNQLIDANYTELTKSLAILDVLVETWIEDLTQGRLTQTETADDLKALTHDHTNIKTYQIS